MLPNNYDDGFRASSALDVICIQGYCMIPSLDIQVQFYRLCQVKQVFEYSRCLWCHWNCFCIFRREQQVDMDELNAPYCDTL